MKNTYLFTIERAFMWAFWLTDEKRDLAHRQGLAKLVHQNFPLWYRELIDEIIVYFILLEIQAQSWPNCN